MAVTLDSTIGGANANTYATRAEADAYAEASAYAASWATLAGTPEVKDALLVRAARVLDTVDFLGAPVNAVQALQWPRWDVEHPSGFCYGSTEIPRVVRDAQCLLAAWLSTQSGDDPFGGSSTAALKRLKAGPVELEFPDGALTAGTDFLQRAILPLLASGGCVASSGSVRLTR